MQKLWKKNEVRSVLVDNQVRFLNAFWAFSDWRSYTESSTSMHVLSVKPLRLGCQICQVDFNIIYSWITMPWMEILINNICDGGGNRLQEYLPSMFGRRCTFIPFWWCRRNKTVSEDYGLFYSTGNIIQMLGIRLFL